MKKIMLMTLVLLTAAVSQGKNVDLVTLPSRYSVQLTIYNSEDLTLVKETRFVTMKKGVNQMQFSWANTLIDPTSVEFRPLEHADKIEVVDTIFPGQKPQHLIWNIESEFEGQVKVEVTYFTSGLTWEMDYVAVTDPAEEKMDFTGYVRVQNNSGEEYDNAQVRLIVGKINLVEKIADLAQRQGLEPPAPVSEEYKDLEKRAAKSAFDEAEMAMYDMDMASGAMAPESAPKGVVKEGVSEYFMFTVDGTETIRDGWSKRMRAVMAEGLLFDIVYRMRAHQYGDRPVRFFIWKNDADHKLGESPLPDGLVRVFRQNENQGLSYLGEQRVNYVPIMADIEINLGPDDLVVYETKKMSTVRSGFTYDQYENVTGWDEAQEWVDTVKNYRTKPIAFELQRTWDGDVEYQSKMDASLFDYRTVEVKFEVGKRGREEYKYSLMMRFGEKKKQDRIEIK
jgi:hypothetical protein